MALVEQPTIAKAAAAAIVLKTMQAVGLDASSAATATSVAGSAVI